MSFEKLLQYQEVDIQLRRILDLIEKSDDFKKITQTKKEFAAAKKAIEDSETAATQLVEFFATAQKYYQDTAQKIEELSAALEKGEGGDPETLIQQLGRLKGRLAELESKVNERKDRSEKVVKAYLDANERGRKMRDIHGRAKDRQDALYKSKESEINELRAKLDELQPQIDPEFIKSYNAITAEHKYPAFVEAYADGKTYSCKGCGMALSQTGSSQLLSSGRCVCESCRRIIYKR